MNNTRHEGFTLIELLIVVMVIMILTGLLLPAISAIRRAAERAKTAARAQVMVNAIKVYRTSYPTYPGQIQGAVDCTYDDSVGQKHSVIIDALTNNPRRIIFNEVVENLTTNSYLDSWNRPYVIAIDEDGDGIVNMSSTLYVPNFSTSIQETVAIMSWGPDPSNSTGRLYSWIR
jgi:prepilin-type N-terminal cleavage/methylation domain-containing protein